MSGNFSIIRKNSSICVSLFVRKGAVLYVIDEDKNGLNLCHLSTQSNDEFADWVYSKYPRPLATAICNMTIAMLATFLSARED